MIDLHSHVLHGIDDGPATLEASLAMARAAADDGTRVLAATPHVDTVYGLPAGIAGDLLPDLQRAIDDDGIPLQVVRGGEVAPERLPALDDDDLRRCALGGGRYLLLESPFAEVVELVPTVTDLHRRGFSVLLAHPERSVGLRRDPAQVEQLVEVGASVSLSAGSIVGQFGDAARRFAATLLRAGLVHDIASDAHDAQRRSPRLSAMVAQADRAIPGLARHLDYFCHAAPAAILMGEAPGEPPRIGPVRGLARLLRRG